MCANIFLYINKWIICWTNIFALAVLPFCFRRIDSNLNIILILGRKKKSRADSCIDTKQQIDKSKSLKRWKSWSKALDKSFLLWWPSFSALIQPRLGLVSAAGPWDLIGWRRLALQCYCSPCKEKQNPWTRLRARALLGSVQNLPSVLPITGCYRTKDLPRMSWVQFFCRPGDRQKQGSSHLFLLRHHDRNAQGLTLKYSNMKSTLHSCIWQEPLFKVTTFIYMLYKYKS